MDMENEEKKILSVEDVLHLQSDKHSKNEQIMPDVDTSRYVLNQRPKTETVRKFVTTANITDEQRRQFSQGSGAPSRDQVLAKQARQAIEIAELHAKEEAKEHAKAASEKNAESAKAEKEIVNEIKSGNFEFGFSALIEGSENLKETI